MILDRIARVWARVLELGAMALMMGLVGVITWSVLGRQVLHITVPWSEEMGAGMLAWMVMLGSGAAWYHRGHLVIDLVLRRLAQRALYVCTVGIELMSLLLLAVAFAGSLSMMSVSAHNSTTALGISYSYLYLALVIGLGSMIVFSLLYLRRLAVEGLAALPRYDGDSEWNT
ncbi:MAG: TRAP transporter small permease [Gemmobacter sp.]